MTEAQAKALADKIIQVIQKPDNEDDGSKSEWWVGLCIEDENGDIDGLWDVSTLDKAHAETVAANVRTALVRAIRRVQSQTDESMEVHIAGCPVCGGTGKHPVDPDDCSRCLGTGIYQRRMIRE